MFMDSNVGGRLDGCLCQRHGAPEPDKKDHAKHVSLDKILFLTKRSFCQGGDIDEAFGQR